MESHLRSVPEATVEEAGVAESALSFAEFYDANFQRIFTTLCLVTGNRHEAEEIAQDAFLRIFERWDRVGAFDDPTGYLFRVSMNLFRNRYRRASFAVRRALSLTPVTDDYSAEDAGEMLGIKASSVRSLTTRARAQMKQEVVDPHE
jgi:DNA-directed RNA polymerase specialized sigma24 family protein